MSDRDSSLGNDRGSTASSSGIWFSVVSIAVGGPLGLGLNGLEPPWPAVGSRFLPVFAVLVSAFAVLLVYLTHLTTQKHRDAAKRWGIVGLVLLGGYALMYLEFVDIVTQKQDGERTSIRIVKGYELEECARVAIRVTGDSRVQSLVDACGVVDATWTSGSLRIVRLSLISLFCAAFALLASALVHTVKGLRARNLPPSEP